MIAEMEPSRGTEARQPADAGGCPAGVRQRAELPKQLSRGTEARQPADARGCPVGVRQRAELPKQPSRGTEARQPADAGGRPAGVRQRAELPRQHQPPGQSVSSVGGGLDPTGAGAGGVGGLLAMTLHDCGAREAESYWVTEDLNGNVIGLLSTTTTKTAVYDYDPFGNPMRVNEPEPGLNPVRFSGKYTDAETGLCYYGFRFYEPEKGRWLNRDPIGEPGGINIYGLVGNRLCDAVDELGLKVITIAFAHDFWMANAPPVPGHEDESSYAYFAKLHTENFRRILRKCSQFAGGNLGAEWSFAEWEDIDVDPNIGPNPVPDEPLIKPFGDLDFNGDGRAGFDAVSRGIKWPSNVTFRVLIAGQWPDSGGQRVNGTTNSSVGNLIILNKSALAFTLAHEIGHVIGWKDPNNGSIHSGDISNLMHSPSGSNPDCQWCTKLQEYGR
ncbi:MAG: hypothetical protein KDK99_01485 [Verrucomicrobiales bacterium]|nr:hypothetical protein [Verrucomicrobiales bacterium]